MDIHAIAGEDPDVPAAPHSPRGSSQDLGPAFDLLLPILSPETDLQPGLFAVAAMGALFARVARPGAAAEVGVEAVARGSGASVPVTATKGNVASTEPEATHGSPEIALPEPDVQASVAAPNGERPARFEPVDRLADNDPAAVSASLQSAASPAVPASFAMASPPAAAAPPATPPPACACCTMASISLISISTISQCNTGY